MATVDFVPFATGGGANVESQASYLADADLPIGQQPGVARSALNNKALRQGTYMASCLAQFISNMTGNDVLDDGTQSEVLATMLAAFKTPPTITKYTSSSGTFTVPANALYLRVRMVGGGGGGAGGSVNNGSNGTATTFGTSLLTANFGSGGVAGAGNGGAGGSATIGSGASGTAITGGGGQGGAGSATTNINGTMGGSSSYFGGAGAGGANGAAGGAAIANTGGGGGGGNASAGENGGGGGAGGFIEAIITGTLSSTYAYAVGTGGAGGAVNISPASTAGGSGAAGYIEVTAYYQ